MNKNEMIQKFLDDVNYDGTYFNHAEKMMREIAVELAKTDERIKTYQPFYWDPTLTVDLHKLPADVTLKLNEALEAAHMHLTTRPGYHQALATRQENMRKTEQSMRAYYEKHGTQGEF